jgi:hypothetical protein
MLRHWIEHCDLVKVLLISILFGVGGRAYGEPLGWLTDHELNFNGKFGYFYVEKI